jgi:putative oxidoreductase
MKFLSPYQDQLYALLRIVSGFLFFYHGIEKFPDIINLGQTSPLNLMVIAGAIELIGGLFIMIGLWTTYSAFICCGEMAVAYWMKHAFNGLLPIRNHGELALLFCFIFLFIAARGSGIFSIDNMKKINQTNRAQSSNQGAPVNL